MYDKSGDFGYSDIVRAVVNGSDAFIVEAFPNPVSNRLTVTTTGNQGGNATVQITDVTGKIMATLDMNGPEKSIDMSSYASGVYLVKYSDANHTETLRITKQ